MNQIDAQHLAATGPRATSLRRALRILGDPWTMLILKDAYNGERKFSGFQRQLNIPKQTLSLRLAHLCREQMMYRRHVGPTHSSFEYALTAKAFDLHDTMYSVWLWHEANPSDETVLPFDIIHRDCGKKVQATFRCATCRGPATSTTVRVGHSQPVQHDAEPRQRLSRRNDGAVTAAGDSGREKMVAASLVGDIAGNEILYLLFQAPAHVKAIAQALDLGLAVARGRLEKLRVLGLVEEQREGRRLVYSVLPKAEDFYPLLLSIAGWGDRWCNAGQPPPELRVHDCGAPLQGRFSCNHCDGWLSRASVFLRPHGAPADEGSSP